MQFFWCFFLLLMQGTLSPCFHLFTLYYDLIFPLSIFVSFPCKWRVYSTDLVCTFCCVILGFYLGFYAFPFRCFSLWKGLMLKFGFADNLLLTANQKSVKLADFGLAREETLTEMMTAETGTYRWMAPEVWTFTLQKLFWKPDTEVFVFTFNANQIQFSWFPSKYLSKNTFASWLLFVFNIH